MNKRLSKDQEDNELKLKKTRLDELKSERNKLDEEYFQLNREIQKNNEVKNYEDFLQFLKTHPDRHCRFTYEWLKKNIPSVKQIQIFSDEHIRNSGKTFDSYDFCRITVFAKKIPYTLKLRTKSLQFSPVWTIEKYFPEEKKSFVYSKAQSQP